MLRVIKEILKLPFNYLKKKKKKSKEVERRISGDWYFIDQNEHKHHLVLTNNFNITIDNNKLDTKLVETKPTSFIFIDKYGYILQINLYNNQPVSIYDEAENISYDLIVGNHN